jgi:hypothetical protein
MSKSEKASRKPGCILIAVIGFVFLVSFYNRRDEFRRQAEAGQPIVRAIEAYHKETGHYPSSLADLVPKDLPVTPDIPDESTRKDEGWDYRLINDGAVTSYSLRYYMGRGGVEYEAPNWFGNDEGNRTIVLSNR